MNCFVSITSLLRLLLTQPSPLNLVAHYFTLEDS